MILREDDDGYETSKKLRALQKMSPVPRNSGTYSFWMSRVATKAAPRQLLKMHNDALKWVPLGFS